MRKVLIYLLISLTFSSQISQADKITDLLQTGMKANEAIDSAFDLLNDLKLQNEDSQNAANIKIQTDEQIGLFTISKFMEILQINEKLVVKAKENRAHFEQALVDAKNYIAWNELRQDEINRKSEVLANNQCYSNQLFVRSIKTNQDCLEMVKLLKNDVSGYLSSDQSFELIEVHSIADKLKKYSSILKQKEINLFLQLATDQQHNKKETVAQRVLDVLGRLTENLEESLINLKENEINASWQLAGWLAGSQTELTLLQTELMRKQSQADRFAKQISDSLAQVVKSNIILRESNNVLQAAIEELQNKRDSYADEKAKRAEEYTILKEVISIFKKQVASYSGRN